MSRDDPSAIAGRMNDRQFESQIVEGLKRDDRESLALAYDAYGAAAFALARRLLGVAAEAEDVVQESFLALWRQAERIDPVQGLRSYLFSIVHNRAIDRLRRRSRRPELPLEPDIPLVDPQEDPSTQVTRKIEVRSAMSGLPAEQRQTIEMVYFLGMTLDQTAKRMNVPLGTVKSRLRLALGHMRQELSS